MGDGDGEPPDSPTSDRSDGSEKRCAYCGDPIDTSDWYPVGKDRDPDGSLRLYSFCSEACRDSWLDERTD